MEYNYNRLKNYAVWYYTRYFPSCAQLRLKLKSKTSDLELIEKVFLDLENVFHEKNVLYNKIQYFLQRNKNLLFIKQKLHLLWFEKDMIEEVLEESFLQENTSLLNIHAVKTKVQNYKNAWKSLQYIRHKMIERPEDEELVEAILREIFDEGESENIQKLLEKMIWKYSNQQIIQKLMWKWFHYLDIKKQLENYV